MPSKKRPTTPVYREEDYEEIHYIENAHNLDEDMVLKHVQEEYELGYSVVQSKRQQKREDLKLYAEDRKDKVSIHTIYTAMQTLMSIYYMDKLSAVFMPRRVSARRDSDNLTKLALFDYDEMELDKIDYQWEWDRLFFGVGFLYDEAWDTVKKVPVFKNLSPLDWIPDPDGGFDINNHRFIGFEAKMKKRDMTSEAGFYNTEFVSSQKTQESDKRQMIRRLRSLGEVHDTSKDNPSTLFSVYHHFTVLHGKKYLITLANDRSIVIRMECLTPVMDEEKKDPLLVPWPVAAKWYSPLDGDPFGVSVPDLLRGNQRNHSMLFNLMLTMATRHALGGDRIYDQKKIKDIKNLLEPSIGGALIPANLKEGEIPQNSIWQIPLDSASNLPPNMQAELMQQGALAVGIDQNQMGVISSRGNTLGEQEIAQRNANTRFLLGSKFAKWGERQRWRLWYRSYRAHLSDGEEKLVALSGSLGQKFYTFKKKDFLSSQDIDIKIVSKSERDIENQKRLQLFNQFAPVLTAAVSSQAQKNFIMREQMRLAGEDEDFILRCVRPTFEELDAELKMQLLNENDFEGAKIERIDADHQTYIEIFEMGQPTKARDRAIAQRRLALMMVGSGASGGAPQGGMEKGMENAMAASASSAMVTSGSANQKPSLQDIAA